jgi:twinkle protein
MKNKEMGQEGVFVRHESCEACGSRDNKAVYDNGDKMTYFCFGCENTGVYEEKGETIKLAPKEFQSSTETINEIKTFDIRGFRERKIKKEIAELYDVKVGYSEEDGNTIKYHYYPITNKGKIVGYERRDLDTKKFLAIGSVKNKDEFFGQSKFAPGSCKRIVVTEGALDAMSVQQVWKDKKQEWAVVSTINGAQGAYKQVAANLSYLNSFEEVVFLFDHDEAGQDGAKSCARLVRTGKAKIGALGRFGKDASDYLVSGKTYELEKAIWNAEKYSPAGIINSADTWELFNEDRREDSVPYPDCFGNVNDMTYGRRTGELTIFTAGTGSGKSTFVKEDIYHLIITTDYQVGVVSLEESVRETLDGVIGVHLNKRINLPDVVFDRSGEEGAKAWQEVAGSGRLLLLDHQGSVTDSSLMDKIEFMAASGCKFIFLDHITLAVSEVEGNANEAMDKAMSDLLKLCKKHDVWIGVVSHLRKTSGGSKTFEEGASITEDSLKGSGSLKQIAFQIIGFSRNKYSDDEGVRQRVNISILKNRFTGHTGPAGCARYDNLTGRLHSTPAEFN